MRTWLAGLALLMTAAACGGDDEPAGPNPVVELATRSVTISGGGAVVTAALYFSFSAGAGDPDTVFARTFIQAGDVGRVLVANQDNEAKFAAVAATLTNGVADQVKHSYRLSPTGGGGSTSGLEALVFPNKVPPGPDFQGYEIESIRFVVDAISLQSPGSNPNGNGIWTDYQLQGRLVIRGRQL